MIDLKLLKLDDARALLGHSAHELPDPSDGSLNYVQTVIDKLCEISQKDPLTGLANRRFFNQVLVREIEVVARSGEPALLLMLDIDHFKNVNDTYGHPAGDAVLQAVANTLIKCVRPMDTVARFGGEEFVVILPSCQGHYGHVVAERIRESISALKISLASGESIAVTISIGGAYAPRWVRSTAELWIDRADIELYRAKSEGRNRVCIEPQPVLAVSAEEKSLLFGPLSLGEPGWIENMAVESSVASSGSAMNRMN
ncbi:GGDEF domain-containing protein [Rhodoferax sp.]|uniref:GGDEF domain-containing protein n=1 Tax=Rhodoferax sp. TaxID=50421 RepID=UPI0026160A1F|nr:GGDEF domain-containing protein [Rhodoferax sp.]MDD2808656.1 GGDEF domain-containing protein [Rhodoferax sp.]MDD4944950.1 GGDEF domain-containing protein [Rhodoferax sp.]MDD5480653.1 GGDEF domain-containing protein [Rhodoferax sp.]